MTKTKCSKFDLLPFLLFLIFGICIVPMRSEASDALSSPKSSVPPKNASPKDRTLPLSDLPSPNKIIPLKGTSPNNEKLTKNERISQSKISPKDGTPLLLQVEFPYFENIWQDLSNRTSERHFSQSIGNIGFISLNKQSAGFRNKVITISGRLLQTREISIKHDSENRISSKETPPEIIDSAIFESWILLDDEKKTPVRLITKNVPLGTVLSTTLTKNDGNSDNSPDCGKTDFPTVPPKSIRPQYGKDRIQATGIYYRLTPFTNGLDFYNTPTIIALTFQFLSKSSEPLANSKQSTSSDPKTEKPNASSEIPKTGYQIKNRLLLLIPLLFLWIFVRHFTKRIQNKRSPKSPFLFWGILFCGGLIFTEIMETGIINFSTSALARTVIENQKNNTSLTGPNHPDVNKNSAKKNEEKRLLSSPETELLFDLFYRLAQSKKNPENGINFQGKIQNIKWIEFSDHGRFSKEIKGYFQIDLLDQEQPFTVYSLELPLFQINKKGLAFKNFQKSPFSKTESVHDSSSANLPSKEPAQKKTTQSNEERQTLGIGQIIGGRGITLDAFLRKSNDNRIFSAENSLLNSSSLAASSMKNQESGEVKKSKKQKENDLKTNDLKTKIESTGNAKPILILFKPEWYPSGILGELGIDAGTLDAVPVFPNNALSVLKKEETRSRKADKNSDDFDLVQLLKKRREVLRALRFTDSDSQFVQSFLIGIKNAPREKLRMKATQTAVSKTLFSAVELFNRPENWQGKLVTLKGWTRRTVYIPITDEKFKKKFGQDHYYQIYLYTDDSQGFPLIVSVPELPKGMKIDSAEDYREEIELTAFFCKTWAYRAAGNIETKKNDQENKIFSGKNDRNNSDSREENQETVDRGDLSSQSESSKISHQEDGTWLHAPFLIGGDIRHFPKIDNIPKSNFPWPIFWGFAFLIFVFYFVYLFIRIFIRVRNRFLPTRKNHPY